MRSTRMRGVANIKIPKNSLLKTNAQNLRKNMTKEEKHLWYDFLKHLPVTIKKQQIIDRYIVDFYCAKYKFVIEIDGTQHYMDDYPEKDKQRDKYLNMLGITVLRYSNYDINNSFESVCEDILNHMK